MENIDPVLKKIQDKLAHLMSSGDILKWMDLLARYGIWVDFSIQAGGPGLLTEPPHLTIPSPLKEEVLCRAERWERDYDNSFLKANRIKLF